jgi:hypothetical protein
MKRDTGIFIKLYSVYVRGIGKTGTIITVKRRDKIGPVHAMKA